MAKNLRKFAPGMSDRMPAQDWCEFIVLETRCENSSHREVIYGSSCGRFCVPSASGHTPKSDSEYGGVKPTYMQITAWSAGGYGAGACCCMSGAPGGGGYPSRTCRKLKAGDTYCYVHAHGGCCYPESAGCNGCYSLVREALSCCENCNEGGRCGRSICFFNYCCHDRVGETTSCAPHNPAFARADVPQNGTLSTACPEKTDYRFHTQFVLNCNQKGEADGLNNQTMPGGHGRRPWDANSRDDKNSIPGGNDKDNQFRNSDPTVNDGVCSAPERSNRFRTSNDRGHAYGFNGYVSRNCHWGCAAWMCGDHEWSWGNMDYDRTSGPAWLNLPRQHSAMTCGGFNATQWQHCMLGGTGAENCWQNIRMVGYGSATATVCGGPCCCGGFVPNGMINFKYR
jgi:hypothetical protein